MTTSLSEIVEIVPSFVPRKIPVTIFSVFLLFSFLLSFFFLLFIGTQIRYLNFFFFHADNCPFRAIERQRKSLEREKEEKEARSIINWEQKKRRRGDRCKKMQAEKGRRKRRIRGRIIPPKDICRRRGRKEGRKGGGDTFLHRGENAPRRRILISPLFPQYPRRNEEHAYLPPSPFHEKRERERETLSRDNGRGETKRNEAERHSATNIHGMTPRKLKATAADAPRCRPR